MQAMLLNKQLMILQSIKEYLPIEKQQLQVFNFINNNLRALQNDTYYLQDITIEVNKSEDQLIVRLIGINKITYVFDLEGDQIINYQLLKQ